MQSKDDFGICKHLYPDEERCPKAVSRIDPEKSYCAEHRRYVFIKTPQRNPQIKIAEKYLDYQTFSASLMI